MFIISSCLAFALAGQSIAAAIKPNQVIRSTDSIDRQSLQSIHEIIQTAVDAGHQDHFFARGVPIACQCQESGAVCAYFNDDRRGGTLQNVKESIVEIIKRTSSNQKVPERSTGVTVDNIGQDICCQNSNNLGRSIYCADRSLLSRSTQLKEEALKQPNRPRQGTVHKPAQSKPPTPLIKRTPKPFGTHHQPRNASSFLDSSASNSTLRTALSRRNATEETIEGVHKRSESNRTVESDTLSQPRASIPARRWSFENGTSTSKSHKARSLLYQPRVAHLEESEPRSTSYVGRVRDLLTGRA